MKGNRSVTLRKGFTGYTDRATGETGNSADCLTRHFGYDF